MTGRATGLTVGSVAQLVLEKADVRRMEANPSLISESPASPSLLYSGASLIRVHLIDARGPQFASGGCCIGRVAHKADHDWAKVFTEKSDQHPECGPELRTQRKRAAGNRGSSSYGKRVSYWKARPDRPLCCTEGASTGHRPMFWTLVMSTPGGTPGGGFCAMRWSTVCICCWLVMPD